MSETLKRAIDPGRARAASERVLQRLRQCGVREAGRHSREGVFAESRPLLPASNWPNVNEPAGEAEAETQRIRIDVPLGTPYREIQRVIFRQAYEQAGTQLRAANALGITPETVSRVLRRPERKDISAPAAPPAGNEHSAHEVDFSSRECRPPGGHETDGITAA